MKATTHYASSQRPMGYFSQRDGGAGSTLWQRVRRCAGIFSPRSEVDGRIPQPQATSASGSASILSRRSIGRTPRWMATGAVAGVLLGAAALTPETADAQTTTFISNTEQSSSSSIGLTASGRLSQSFQTGTSSNGEYRITRIVIHTRRTISAAQRSAVRAEIWDNSGSNPGSLVASLTVPESVTTAAGNHNFDVMGGSVKIDNTATYHIVLRNTSTTLGELAWSYTNTDAKDSGSAADWSIPARGRGDFGSGSLSTLSAGPVDTPHLLFQVIGQDAGYTLLADGGARYSGDVTNSPVLSGEARLGERVSVDSTGVMDPDGSTTSAPARNTAAVTLASPYFPETVTAAFALPGQLSVTNENTNNNLLGAPGAAVIGHWILVCYQYTRAGATRDFVCAAPYGPIRAANTDPAGGPPTISGTVQVGQQLTAVTTGITDADGPDPLVFEYQWWRADDAAGAGEAEIGNADSSTYRLTPADLGKHIRVVVSYTDDNDSDESLESAWSVAVTAAALPVITVRAKAASIVGTGNPNAEFILTRTGDPASTLTVGIAVTGSGLRTSSPPTETVFPAALATVEVSVSVNALGFGDSSESATLTVQPGNGYTVGTPPDDEATVTVTGPTNNDAMGNPSVGGMAQVGQTLRAGIGDITDADSQPTEGDLNWQWQRETSTDNWEDIDSATSQTYMLGADDLGMRIRVRAGFVDQVTQALETLFSLPTAAVAASAGTLPEVTVVPKTTPIVGNRDDAVFVISRETATATQLVVNFAVTGDASAFFRGRPSTATIPANESSVEVSIRTSSLADGDAFSITLTISDDSAYTVGTDRAATVHLSPPSNSRATGQPTISGTGNLTAGEMLTAVTTGISDPDGPPTLTFTSYQWRRADDSSGANAKNIPNADSATYTLQQADVGHHIGVTVHYTDDDSIGESVSSAWTTTAVAAGALPEVSVSAESARVVGGSDAVFVISREAATVAPLEVQFTVGGEPSAFRGSTRPSMATIPANETSVEVTIQTSSLAPGDAFSITLTIDDDSAYMVGTSRTATIDLVEAGSNSPPQGEVTISGTLAVGETLMAVRDFTDADGLVGVTFNYVWRRTDDTSSTSSELIDGATSETYTITAADLGQHMQVFVNYTDQGGTEQSVGSDWTTTAVAAAAPTAPVADSVFTIDGPSAAITEPASGTANLTFTVALVRPAGQETASFTVDYQFSGSASEGRDFSEHSDPQRLVFGPRITTQTITVAVNSDIVAERGGETVVVTLVNPSQGASLGAAASATGTINEPSAQEQIIVAATVPQYTEEDRTVRFDITLSRPAPVAGMVEWRLAFEGVTGAAAASTRSAQGRAAVACTLRGCSGTAEFAAGSRVPRVPVSAVFSSEPPAGAAISLQVKPFAPASGSTLPPNTAVAVQPPPLASGETETITADGYVVASEGKLAKADQTALIHVVADAGRSVAAGIVNGIWSRAEARRARSMGSRAMLGGRTLNTQALSSRDAGRTMREFASLLGLEATAPDGSPDGLGSGYGGGFGDYLTWAGIPDQDRLASQTSFALTAGEGDESGPLAIWGSSSMAARESKPNSDSFVESESSDILLGFDLPISSSTSYGLAVNRSSSEVEYSSAAASVASSAETGITTFAPYLFWTTPSGEVFWLSAGIGTGTLTQTAVSGTVEFDLSMHMFAGGGRIEVWDTRQYALSLKADALLTSTEMEQSMSSFGNLEAVDAASNRTRLAVEWASHRNLADIHSLFYSFELGMRIDDGDADDGAGADIAGEFRYASQSGIEMHGRASLTLLHFQDGVKDWGLGLGAVYDPGVKERGVSLSLEPTWNAPRSGVAESMWGSQYLDSYASSNAGALMKARMGYGAETMRKNALATLYGEAETGDENRKLRLGAELRGLSGPLERVSLDIYGEREDRQTSSPTDSIMLEGSLGF